MGVSRRGAGRRALRRHHAARVRARAREVVKQVWQVPLEDVDRLVVRLADHLANCSCPGCGHARRHQGVTCQEQRAAIRLDDDGCDS